MTRNHTDTNTPTTSFYTNNINTTTSTSSGIKTKVNIIQQRIDTPHYASRLHHSDKSAWSARSTRAERRWSANLTVCVD